MPTITDIQTPDGKKLDGQTISLNGPIKLIVQGDTPGRTIRGMLWGDSGFTHDMADLTIPGNTPVGSVTVKIRYQGDHGDIPPELAATFNVAPPAAVNPNTASISGTLWNDTDADGVQDSSESATGVRTVLLLPLNVTVQSDNLGNYIFPGLAPGTYSLTRNDFPPGYRLSNPTVAGGNVITVTVAAGQNRNGVNIGTTNRVFPPPVVDHQPIMPQPQKWIVKGACFAFGDAAGPWPGRAVDEGLTHLRAFANSCDKQGNFNGNYLASVKQMLDQNPALKVIGVHGMSEGPTGQHGEPVYDQSVWDKYWSNVAASLKGYESRYYVELNNEINDPHYFNAGQSSSGTFDQRVVDTILMVAKSAHANLPGIYLISPSIGWDASPALPEQYHRALSAAGVYNLCNGANDHCYNNKASDVRDRFNSLKSNAPGKDLWCTEAHPKPLPDCAAAFREIGVRPMFYRLMARNGHNDRDCLFDADGNRAGPILQAWGYAT